MLNVTKTNENRIDIELAGKLDSAEMEEGLDAMFCYSAGVEHGKLFYEIKDFHMPSLDAIGVKLARLPSLFGLIAKFDKAAVLTDESWVQTASKVEGWLIPGLEIRAFSLNEREAAEAWLEA